MSVDNPETEMVSEETEVSSEGQESEVDTESSDGTEETASEASSESGDGTSSEEWVVPGRYRTVEDLKNAQRYFESENSRRANELHQLRQRFQQPTVDPKEEVERFASAVKKNPVEAVRDITRNELQATREEVKQIRFETEYRSRLQNKEFAELEPVMTQIAKQYEDMILVNGLRHDPRLLDVLYLAAKGAKMEDAKRTAEQRGKQKGERAAHKKLKAQVEGSSGSKGHVKRKFEELSREEMKKEIEKGRLND